MGLVKSVLFCMTCSRVQVFDYFPSRSNLIFPLHRLCSHYRTCKLVEVRFSSVSFVSTICINHHVSRNLANLAAMQNPENRLYITLREISK